MAGEAGLVNSEAIFVMGGVVHDQLSWALPKFR
jgi:hypothetical protein